MKKINNLHATLKPNRGNWAKMQKAHVRYFCSTRKLLVVNASCLFFFQFSSNFLFYEKFSLSEVYTLQDSEVFVASGIVEKCCCDWLHLSLSPSVLIWNWTQSSDEWRQSEAPATEKEILLSSSLGVLCYEGKKTYVKKQFLSVTIECM